MGCHCPGAWSSSPENVPAGVASAGSLRRIGDDQSHVRCSRPSHTRWRPRADRGPQGPTRLYQAGRAAAGAVVVGEADEQFAGAPGPRAWSGHKSVAHRSVARLRWTRCRAASLVRRSTRHPPRLTMNELGMAIENRRPAPGASIHSDHGTQFTSWGFTRLPTSPGLVPSRGSIGDCLDNAVIESFWACRQVELLNRRRWTTRVELANAISEYLKIFHNRPRRHGSPEMRTPTDTQDSRHHRPPWHEVNQPDSVKPRGTSTPENRGKLRWPPSPIGEGARGTDRPQGECRCTPREAACGQGGGGVPPRARAPNSRSGTPAPGGCPTRHPSPGSPPSRLRYRRWRRGSSQSCRGGWR